VAATDTVDGLAQLGLTPREAEIALAVLRGQTTVAIAADLVVSPHTVHAHLRSIFDKLGVSSRQQLAMRLLGARHAGAAET
jgi:DNA-binding NarL/FixJ family response regulator